MKKVLFLMFLLFLFLGTAGVKAQVRIGGSGAPNTAAVLDLNADDSATPAGNKGALALPRVSLASTTAPLNGATPINGMLVYNTGGTLATGIYYWNGVRWMALMPLTRQDGTPFVTWTRSLDTVVNIGSYTANTIVGFAAPSVSDFDFCVSDGSWVVTNDAGFVKFFFPFSTVPGPYRFRCYTPNP